MDAVTHVSTGILLSQLLPTPSRLWGVLAATVFALLPDIDFFLLWVDRLAFIRIHRSLTHSLVAVLLLALLGAAAGRFLGGPRWFKPLFFLGLAVLSAHLFLDLATSYGTQIFSPFSRRKFALDWLFIIDPYLTGILVLGAVAVLGVPAWARQIGAWSLGFAGAYILLCGFYHHQALALARQVFAPQAQTGAEVAALPQPFSCRRWQLIAAGPEGIRQTFVQMPYPGSGKLAGGHNRANSAASPANPGCRVPAVPYEPPQHLLVHTWTGAPLPSREYTPEARRILEAYLEFARFPLLHRVKSLGEGQLLEWLDLRFSVPGRAFPFVLQLRLDAQGRVQKWVLGPCAGEEN